MKRIIFLFLLFAVVGKCKASTFTAATCGVADIRTAIALTSSGDTVNVPAGNCTWTTGQCTGGSCLNITHPIFLIAASSNITDTTARNGSIIPIYVHYTDTTNSEARVSGFNFIDNGASDGFNGTVDWDLTDSGGGKPTIRLDHNSWASIDGRRWFVALGTPVGRGLVDHNTVVGATDSIVSPDSYDLAWQTSTGYGNADAIYLENNTFTFNNYVDYVIDCQYGGRYVARFNVSNFSSAASGASWGDHGYDSVYRGCFSKEVYNNTGSSSVSGAWYFINFRGGSGMIFNNAPTGNWVNSIGLTNYRSATDYTNSVGYCPNATPNKYTVGCYSNGECSGAGGGTCVQGGSNICTGSSPVDGNTGGGAGYRCLDQIGTGIAQALVPAYEWLNTLSASAIHFATFCGGGSACTNQDTLHILANRDFYNYTASFTGATGVGSGTRASRPATCTTGVAYWSTDQGSWNTSGSGGQGVLDVCTSTNTWTNAQYVPYTYPHPLDTNPAPGAPTALTTIVF